MIDRFQVGCTVVVRGIMSRAFVTGGVCDVKPVLVAADSDELIALWVPLGVPTMESRPIDSTAPRPWLANECRLVPATWRYRHALKISLPGQRWSTWVTWSAEWEFLGWYVNLQSLLCRSGIGFDVRDHQLDIVVAPDGRWRWKDEADLERAVAVGLFSAEEAATIRRAGEEAIAVIEANGRPFGDPWARWRPEPDWSQPVSIPEWQDPR